MSSDSGAGSAGASSTTSCPSSRSSAAAECRPCTTSGSASTSSALASVIAIRSLPGVAAHRERVGLGRPRRPGRVARLVARQHVEQQRGLGDRAREHAVRDEERVAQVGPARDAPAAGLEADEPAAGGRDPQRAAAVVAVRDRDEAGRDRRRGAAGRAARRARRCPTGCASGPLWRGSVVGRIPNSGMFVVPMITKPASRSRRTRYALCVGRWPARKREPKFMHSPATGDVRLDRDRHAGERALVARLDRVGLGERALGVELDERAELRVDRLDPPERRLDGLAGAETSRRGYERPARWRA